MSDSQNTPHRKPKANLILGAVSALTAAVTGSAGASPRNGGLNRIPSARTISKKSAFAARDNTFRKRVTDFKNWELPKRLLIENVATRQRLFHEQFRRLCAHSQATFEVKASTRRMRRAHARLRARELAREIMNGGSF